MAEPNTGAKRKRGGEPKFYAVNVGKRPGVYHTYADCLEQVSKFPSAIFKSFSTQADAEHFVKYGLQSNSSAPTKYYGVRVGKVPGVYTDWPSAQQQIIGFKGPKYKSFSTKQEAEAFVKNESPQEGDASHKATSKAKRTRSSIQAPELDEIDESIEAGFGPLPKGAADGFDPRIQLNPHTGNVEYKPEEKLRAAKMRATGVIRNEPLQIFTDGSSLKNGAVGARAGVGVYFGPKDLRNVSEPLKGPRQTNQRAELTACKRAIEIAPRDRDIIIFTDSKYAIQCLTEWFITWRKNNWMTSDKKPVENKDLVEPILQAIDQRKRMRADTKFEYVKGHAGNEGNTAADALAVNGAREGVRIDMDT